MGVYETATKLASEIKNSKEYRSFKKYMNEVKQDKQSEELLKNYRLAQIEIQNHAMRSLPLDKKSQKKIEELQKKVINNKTINNYLISEERFTTMMNNINKILGDSVQKDYK